MQNPWEKGIFLLKVMETSGFVLEMTSIRVRCLFQLSKHQHAPSHLHHTPHTRDPLHTHTHTPHTPCTRHTRYTHHAPVKLSALFAGLSDFCTCRVSLAQEVRIEQSSSLLSTWDLYTHTHRHTTPCEIVCIGRMTRRNHFILGGKQTSSQESAVVMISCTKVCRQHPYCG